MHSKKGNNFFYHNRFIIASFFLPMVFLLIIYAIRGLYPFGNGSVLRVDLYHQYAPFLEEFRSRVLNGQSLVYSWESGLGKEFLTQMAYYTASPFSLLIFFFPQDMICESMLLIITLKICLSASVSSYYIREHFQKNDLSILLFGLMYAFCSFVTGFYWNVMWLDTVYLFPLVALGTERLVHEDKHTLYYISLCLTMITNFYMAVLVCVFISLYFLILLLANYPLKGNLQFYLKRSLRFATVSILCAMTASFILLPVAKALGQTATSDTSFPAWKIYDNVYQLFANHFLGAKPSVLTRNEDLPNIYTGMLTLVLLPAYYFNRKINRKEKWLISALLLFMLLCCCVKPLDFMIHGFHFPANLPHRFTFIYSFFLLYLAYSGYLYLRECSFKFILGSGVFYLILLLVSEYYIVPRIEDIDPCLSNTDVLLSVLAICIYTICCFFLMRLENTRKTILLSFLLVCVSSECIFSGLDGFVSSDKRSSYLSYFDGANAALEQIKAQEEEPFYRTDFRRFTAINEGSLYHFSGFSCFSSLMPGGIAAFMKSLGIAATGNSFRFYDPTPLVNAITSIRYVMNKDKEMAEPAYKYEYIDQFDNIYLYANTRTLPLGFLVNEEITSWNLENSQPFAVQNAFIQKATGLSEDLFLIREWDELSTENISVKGSSLRDNDFSYSVDHPSRISDVPKVTASYTSEIDQYLYLYVDAGNAKRFIYELPGDRQDRELSTGNSMVDLGFVHAGETLNLEFSLNRRGSAEKKYRENGNVKLYLAAYQDDIFQKAYDILKEQTYDISSFEDTHIEGTVTADKDSILFTSIPYIDSWMVQVDGQSAEILPIGKDGVIGVQIPSGTHTVIFQYRLKIFTLAIFLSFSGVVLYLMLYMKERKKLIAKGVQHSDFTE